MNKLENNLPHIGDHLDLFVKMQKILNPEFCLEIGCHEATFSKRVAEEKIPSYAFEADPEIFNFWSNKNNSSFITFINKAVYDNNKDVSFYKRISDENVGNNSMLLKNEKWNVDSKDPIQEIIVSGITIDSFIEQNYLNDKKFSMWIDAEGVGYEALIGSNNNIKIVNQ